MVHHDRKPVFVPPSQKGSDAWTIWPERLERRREGREKKNLSFIIPRFKFQVEKRRRKKPVKSAIYCIDTIAFGEWLMAFFFLYQLYFFLYKKNTEIKKSKKQNKIFFNE